MERFIINNEFYLNMPQNKIKDILNISLICLFIIFLLLTFFNLYNHHKENVYVYHIFNSKLNESDSDIEKLTKLNDMVHNSIEPIPKPKLEPIRKNIECGGDCSDMVRLLITSLRFEDIYVKRTALYRDSSRNPVHATVQAFINDREIIADPYKHIIFRNKTDYVDKFDLMKGNYDLGNRSYQYKDALHDIRSERWNDFWFTTLTYKFINNTFGEKFARNLGRPYFMERFYLFRFAIFLFLSVLIGLILVLLNWNFLNKNLNYRKL